MIYALFVWAQRKSGYGFLNLLFQTMNKCIMHAIVAYNFQNPSLKPINLEFTLH